MLRKNKNFLSYLKCLKFPKIALYYKQRLNLKFITMKKLFFALITLCFLLSCNDTKSKVTVQKNQEPEPSFTSFGDVITSNNVLSENQMTTTYENLTPGDTLQVKFKAIVNSVCQSKGCWMRVDLGQEQAMVKFKDYGFFVPKDLAGQEVIMQGKAFVAEVSVDEQRHYAEDAGKTPEEVLAITEPKKTLSFESSGVLVPVVEIK